jgi:hypothetical protein
VPLITFDNHYSSDEEMVGPAGIKKTTTPQVNAKKPTTNRKREELPRSPMVKEAVISPIGSQKEAAILR